MASFEVRRLDAEGRDAWDDLVAKAPEGTLFHTTRWMEGTEEPYTVYGAYKGDRLAGGFVCSTRRTMGRSLAFHPRLTPYLGMVVAPSQGKQVTHLGNVKKIARSLADRLQADHHYVHVKLAPGVVELQPYIWAGFDSRVRYTYRLGLDDTEQAWEAMDSSRRRDIRSARKEGVEADPDGDFDELLDLAELTFDRKDAAFDRRTSGGNPVLLDPQCARSILARDETGRAIAGVHILWDDDRAYYLLGGHAGDAGHHGATALAMWEAIEAAAEMGLQEFDFEGSMIPGVERFFRKFGGTYTPYYAIRWETQLTKLLRLPYETLGDIL